MMVQKTIRLGAAAAAVSMLFGCSSLNFTGDKVQYEASNSRAPLEIPPDLNSVPRNDRFTIPTRPQIYSANAEAAKAERAAQERGESVSQILPETHKAVVKRDGQIRYVHVEAPAEQVWPLLQDFWSSVGLAIKTQDATTGVIQTEWAENKANLPQDIIRGTIGKVLDFAYDTGERDQYRARMERNEDGTTNIYVTHRQMVEVLKGKDGDSTMWQPGASDPQLEGEMLTRLAQKLESEFNPDAKPQEQAAVDALAAVKYKSVSHIEDGALIIDEPFDRAWRRVSLAIDRAGFDVKDRDRSQGLFMVTYLDPDYEAKMKADQGFFTNVFSKTKPVDAVPYQIRLVGEGEKSRLTVTGAEGRADTTGVAPKIVQLIGEQAH